MATRPLPTVPHALAGARKGLTPVAFPEQLSHWPVFPMFQKGAYIVGLCFVSVLSELCQQTCTVCAQRWAPWKEGTRPRSSH